MAQGLYNAQSGTHRPLGIIFVRQGIAKIDQQAIAEILGDMPLKAGNHLGAGLLIGPHHHVQVFWVELGGECGRIHQVAKQHGELTAFSVSRTRCGWEGGERRGWRMCCACPDQHVAVFIHGQALAIDEFLLQVLQDVIV